MCHTGKAHAARWIVYNSTNSDSLKHQLRTASPVNYPITKLANSLPSAHPISQPTQGIHPSRTATSAERAAPSIRESSLAIIASIDAAASRQRCGRPAALPSVASFATRGPDLQALRKENQIQ
jgi:hypothetical protein